MKVPHLEPKQRVVAALGAVAVVVLVVVGVVALGGDDDTEPAATEATTTTTADDAAGPTTADEADPDRDAKRAGTSTTTTTPPTTTTADGDDAGAGDPAAGGAEDGDGTGAGGTGGGGTAGAGADQPAPDADPVGGGEGANVGVVDPASAQSPPAIKAPGPQGPTRSEGCAPTGSPNIPLPITDRPSGDGGSWVSVGSLAGNCGKVGGTFETTGVDTRLVFRSDAEQMIVFVDDPAHLDDAAGYADVECRSRCAGTRILTIRRGTYRLRVKATDAPWTVELQEYRR